MEAKPSQKDVFEFCGPPRPTSCLDWTMLEHKRPVLACLVKAVYVAEKDRQKSRTGDKQLAPAWWEAFHFKCIKIIKDKNTIFGAIFESMAPQIVPTKYVIAFRGTMLKIETAIPDGCLDAMVMLNKLHSSTRCEIAFDAAEDIIGKTDSTNVCLVGHSLGASIALQIGRDMRVKKGYLLETYLFNPPFPRLPFDILDNGFYKNLLRNAQSISKVGLSLVSKITKNNDTIDEERDDAFTLLNSWIPYLFVNPEDLICCEYIGYFEQRKKMEKQGMGVIERTATKTSILSLVWGALGKDCEASHLIPSAFVTKNMKKMNVNKEHGTSVIHGVCQWWEQHLVTHRLSQWWEQHPCWQSKRYTYC